jgi:hypothetical protein
VPLHHFDRLPRAGADNEHLPDLHEGSARASREGLDRFNLAARISFKRKRHQPPTPDPMRPHQDPAKPDSEGTERTSPLVHVIRPAKRGEPAMEEIWHNGTLQSRKPV